MTPALLFRRSVVAVLLILTFVLQGTTSVLAGTTGGISGTVVDASSGKPIANEKVTATSPSQTAYATTDASGHYAFISLAPDTFLLSVPAGAIYDAGSISGVTVIADQVQTIVVRQSLKLQTIGTVTSRASGALVKPGTTADIYSVSPTQQDKVAAIGGGGNLNSAWSAIATVPGVFIAPNQAGYIGAGPSISIRGGDYDQIGYEFDGVPVNRSFDNYPSSAISSLGQQELQVYTGANPANSEGQGLSGYINQVIRTGTSPATRDVDLGIGSPTFYNKFSLEAGGASPSRMFSYYIGLGGYNQDYRYGDNYNGSSLTQLAGVPIAPCDPGSVSQAAAPSCYSASGADYTNGGATPAYVLAPYNIGALSNIRDRDSVVNLHFGIPQKDGNKDDIQILYDGNHIGNTFYLSTNDLGGTNRLSQIGTLGVPVYYDGVQYNGPTGAFLPSNYASLISNYYYPGSPTGRENFAPIPPGLEDGISNDQQILKFQYQHNFGSNAYLRAYGYTYYSDWLQIGPQSAFADYIGPSSPDYELSSHTRGVSATFADQITPQHLITLQGNYTTSNSLRDNNTQMFNDFGLDKRGIFAVAVNSANPYGGLCYTAAGAPTTCDFNVAGANLPTSAAYASLAGAQSPYDPVNNPNGIQPLATNCGTGTCQYLVVGNGQFATYNTVKPKFTSFSLTDDFKPTDKFTLNLGLRFDQFQFQGANTQGTAARTFFYNAFNIDYCEDSTGAVVDKTTIYGAGIDPSVTPCAAPYKQITITNPTGIVTETYNALQPRVGATYALNPRTVVRASYGRYVEAPNSAFQQYDTLQPDAPYTLYNVYNFQRFGFTSPDHSVRPPVSNNYDFSFEHQFGGDLAIKITPFLRKTQDQIQQFYLDQQTGFVSGLNVGKQTSQGFEFELDKGDFSRNGFSGKLSFAYTNSYINYTNLPNGTTVVDPINTSILGYNAYTSFCSTHTTDKRCSGATQSGNAASPCYTTGGAADPTCAAGDVANPYWNAPVQGLLNPKADYPTFDTFPGGGIGTAYQSYGAPYVLTAIVQYKHDKLAITPSLQFIAGQRYGAPITTPGVAPDTCGAPFAATVAADPRYPYGAPGGGSYDSTNCTGGVYIPDQYTKTFDGIGAFRAPSQLLLNTQISYDFTKRFSVVGNFANIVNRCFGGTGAGFTVNGACNYSVISPSGLAPIGNVYNPGFAIQPYLATPYSPEFAGFPFNAYFEARFRL